MRARIAIAAAAFVLVAACLAPPLSARDGKAYGPAYGPYHAGQLLVATPKLADPNFSHTVIYLLSHNADGAFGLVINRLYGSGPLAALLEGFGVEADGVSGNIRIHYGGPVQPGGGFVLHTSDYEGPGTMRAAVDSSIALTSRLEVLKAIAEGSGPRRSLFALGYSGWGKGQLEGEVARGDWITAPADPDLVFDDDLDAIWERAYERAGLPM